MDPIPDPVRRALHMPDGVPTDTSRTLTLPMRTPAERIADQLTVACCAGRISQDAAHVLASLVRLHERGDRVTDPEYAALGMTVATAVFRGAV